MGLVKSTIEEIKIRIYKSSLYLGAIVPFVIWVFDIESFSQNTINRIFLPIISICCIISVFLFKWFGEKFIRIFERTIYTITFLYMLMFILYVSKIGLASGIFDLQKFLIWMPMIYIISFLMFQSREALRLSIFFLSLLVIIGIFFLYLTRESPYLIQNIQLLFEMYAASTMYIIVLYIITLLKNRFREEEVRAGVMLEMAYTDSLTGIPNRRKIQDLIQYYINGNIVISIIMVDINHFKAINDTFGHDQGDLILIEVAEILRESFRSHDTVGRWGGDEFIVICPEVSKVDRENIYIRMNRINEDPRLYNTGCSLSFGLSTYESGKSVDLLIKQADQALYEQKRSRDA